MPCELTVATWTEMSKAQHTQVRSLIEAGGEVNPATLVSLLGRARWLAFASDPSGTIQAVAALKTPNASYRDKVFNKAGTSADASDYAVELGWIFAAPEARGHRLGERLSERLMQSEAGPVYATSADDDDHRHVHAMLERLGFDRAGQPYEGSRGRMISLYLREAASDS